MGSTVQEAFDSALRLENQGRVRDAALAYERLLQTYPGVPDAWFNLAAMYRRQGRYRDALSAYQNALSAGIDRPEEVHVNRSVVYSNFLQMQEQAEHELNVALSINPKFVPALMNMATLRDDAGRRHDAIGIYETILEIEPHCYEALARLANAMSIASPDDSIFKRLRAALAKNDVAPPDRASLEFSLGRALDAAGEFESAFTAYCNANKSSWRTAPPGAPKYDRGAQERYVDEMIAAFPTRALPLDRSAPQPRPIFICGMLRSGSTLVESILACHSQVSSGGELYFLPTLIRQSLPQYPSSVAIARPEDFATLAKFYLEAMNGMFPGSKRITDKRMDNFLHIGLIKKMFPSARIVLTRRNGLDNCLSVFFLHAAHSVNYAFDLQDVGHYYKQHLRLTDHWRSLFGEDIIDVNYDELVADPKQSIAALLQRLELDWEDACLNPQNSTAPVKTASNWQVREPLHRRSSERWRNYAERISQLRVYLTGD